MEYDTASVDQAIKEAKGYQIETFATLEDAQNEYPENDYMILTDEDADEKCKEYIKDSVWAFNSWFLAECTGFDECIFKALQNKYEDSNDAILSLIEKSCGLDSFVTDAIGADGRGHFLSSYDGNENEIKIGTDIFYLYRI